MDNSDIENKKSLRSRISDYFMSFISIFIKKEKLLPEASLELTEELTEVNKEYRELLKDDSFEGLKNTYYKYRLGISADDGLIAVEKNTGYVMNDPKFVARVRFNSLWRKSAFANLDIKDEDACVLECYSENSMKIYNEIKDEIQKELKKTGNIDTRKVLDLMKDSDTQWARVVSRRMFKTQPYAEIVTGYFRSITHKPKKQTKATLSLSQAIYGDILE